MSRIHFVFRSHFYLNIMFWWKISSLQIAHESIYQMRSHQNRIYCVISFEFSCYQHLMWYFARQAIEFGVMFPVADCMAMHLLRACIWQTKYMNLKTRIFSDTIVSACSFECIQSNKRKKKKILLEVIFCVVMHLSYAKIINFGNSNDTNDDHHFHCFYVKYHRKTYDSMVTNSMRFNANYDFNYCLIFLSVFLIRKLQRTLQIVPKITNYNRYEI